MVGNEVTGPQDTGGFEFEDRHTKEQPGFLEDGLDFVKLQSRFLCCFARLCNFVKVVVPVDELGEHWNPKGELLNPDFVHFGG